MPTARPPRLESSLPVDVYALGVILWQLWYKATPFDGKGPHRVMGAVLSGKRPEPPAGLAAPPQSLKVVGSPSM